MALNLPGFVAPQGYGQAPDIAGRFAGGFDWGRGVANESDAAKVLGEYARSLYTGQQPAPNGAPQQQPPMSLMDLAQSPNAGNRIIGAEHASAEGAVDPTLASYFGNVSKSESGGSNTAKNPLSTALGKYQFLSGTWDGLMKAHPELGLTPDGRTDAGQQDRAMMAFTTDNAKVLKASGLPVNPGSLYAAHYLGAQGASDVLKLPDNTPMVSAVSPEVVAANPSLQNMTVGDFKNWTAQHASNGKGGYQAPLAPQDVSGTSAAGDAPAGLPPREVLAALFQNPDTRSFAAQLVTAGKAGTLTETQKNYATAVSQGYRGTLLDYQKELKTSGVTVNTGDNSSKFTNKADELAAARLSDYVSAGDDAQQFTGDMLQLADLSKRVTTGKSAEIATALGPWAETLGIKIDGLSDAQAYQSIISRLAPKMRAPGSGSSSDTDVRMFLQSLPNLGNTPEGNKIINDTFMGVQQRKIQAAGISQQALSGEITWQEADKRISALGDPYTAFKKFQAGKTVNDKKTGAAPATGAPPASYDGDPSLWRYMTPEEQALWQ